VPGGRVELPTNPKAFGAALLRVFLTSDPLQIVNCELWILLSL
jgi:hypothetical protein